MAENEYIKSDNMLSSYGSILPFNPDDCHVSEPFAGYRNNDELNEDGYYGCYWSGTNNEDNDNAYNLNFNDDGNRDWDNNNRKYGQSVRPVTELTGCPSSLLPFKTTPEVLLLDLYKAYKDARKHKRRKRKIMYFSLNLEEELIRLRDEILAREYKPSPCNCFVIRDPKTREIFAADFRDRVVHHLIYNYTKVLFEHVFIYDTYSCIKNRGTHFGIRRLNHHIRSISKNYTKTCYILKMDIKGHFMHIDRELLLNICYKTLESIKNHQSDETGKTWNDKLDYSLIQYLLYVIIMNDPLIGCIRKGRKSEWETLPESKSLFHSPKGCGLPIGNLTSQLFSNVYMNKLDQYAKRHLKCKAYGRYVDDFFIISNYKSELRDISHSLNKFLKKHLRLEVNKDKTIISNAYYGCGFLGAYIKPYRIYIHNRPLKRIRESVRYFENITDPESLQSRTNSYLGALSHYKTYNERLRTFASQTHFYKFGYFGNSILKYTLKAKESDNETIVDKPVSEPYTL